MSLVKCRTVFVLLIGLGLCLSPTLGYADVVGQLWQFQPDSLVTDALIANTPATAPDAKFNPAAINYDSRVSGYAIQDFLKNPTFYATSGVFDPTGAVNNVFFLFTGQTYLQAGENSFVTPHDDGFELLVKGAFSDSGMTTPFDLQQGGPTAPVDTPYSVYAPVAGLYDFTLSYGECCGPPAVLGFTVNNAPVGNVPEPATLILLGSGLAGLAGLAWRKN